MTRVVSVLAMIVLVLSFTACGSGAEADLERSPEELKEKAKGMDKAELEAAIENLKGMMEDIEAEGKNLDAGDAEEAMELFGRAGKISTVMMVYQMELASRK